MSPSHLGAEAIRMLDELREAIDSTWRHGYRWIHVLSAERRGDDVALVVDLRLKLGSDEMQRWIVTCKAVAVEHIVLGGDVSVHVSQDYPLVFSHCVLDTHRPVIRRAVDGDADSWRLNVLFIGACYVIGQSFLEESVSSRH